MRSRMAAKHVPSRRKSCRAQLVASRVEVVILGATAAEAVPETGEVVVAPAARQPARPVKTRVAVTMEEGAVGEAEAATDEVAQEAGGQAAEGREAVVLAPAAEMGVAAQVAKAAVIAEERAVAALLEVEKLAAGQAAAVVVVRADLAAIRVETMAVRVKTETEGLSEAAAAVSGAGAVLLAVA